MRTRASSALPLIPALSKAHGKDKFRLKRIVLTLIILALQGSILFVSATCFAQTWDATAQFSPAYNGPPNNIWSYGYAYSLGTFNIYTAERTIPFVGPSGQEWYPAGEENQDRPDLVYWVPSTSQLTIAAGPNGEYSIVRWTAPAGGTYSVSATFSGFWAQPQVDGDVHVLLNNQHLFDDHISPKGNPPVSYSGQITVSQGDVVDFAIGVGLDGSNSFDRAILTATISSCQASVTGVKMTNSHKLELDVSGQFSSDPNSTKSLSVSTTVNGVPLNASFQLPPGTTGTQSNSFSFDLTNVNNVAVPRFTDNAIFPVIAGQSENLVACSSPPVNGIVLLPTIVVPGIGNGDGGDHTYQALESYFMDPTKVIGPLGGVGEAYQLRQNPSNDQNGCASSMPDQETYPTLFTLNYHTTTASFARGSAALSSCVQSALQLTYAANVNLVGHSKGGLVARQNVEGQDLPPVDRVIMAETPNLGALKAAWEQFFHLHILDNLLPVWPWTRKTTNDQFEVDPPNIDLEILDTEQVLPQNVAYTIIYSKYAETQVTRTGRHAPYSFGYDLGDGIVPWFSQTGQIYDPNQQTQSYPLIPAFVGASITSFEIDHPHPDYFTWTDVLQRILSQLLTQR